MLGILGNVAKTASFGVARKHSAPKKPATRPQGKKRKGKGILTNLAKAAVKSVANKGIEIGADFLKEKVSGMGNKRLSVVCRIRGHRAPPAKRSFGGSGVDGGALYPGGYGGAMYLAGMGVQRQVGVGWTAAEMAANDPALNKVINEMRSGYY
jgi:hypothetical protein